MTRAGDLLTGRHSDALRSTVHPASRDSSPRLGECSDEDTQVQSWGPGSHCEEGAPPFDVPGGRTSWAGPNHRQAQDFAPTWSSWTHLPRFPVPSPHFPPCRPASAATSQGPRAQALRPAHKIQPGAAASGRLLHRPRVLSLTSVAAVSAPRVGTMLVPPSQGGKRVTGANTDKFGAV